MVITPVEATLETAEPEIEPNSPEATTAILAEPPRDRPMRAAARSVNHSDAPVWSRSWPIQMNSTTVSTMILSGRPSKATLVTPSSAISRTPSCS